MASSVVTSKGQITIPKEVRDALGVDAGDRIEFVEGAQGRFEIVLCELAWVLAECYGADEARIRAAIDGLLAARQIAVEAPELVRKALRAWTQSGADFADALIGEIAAAHGAGKTLTFDRAAAKLPGFELL
jgi:AbrB family looped-hinge helix DNA binding protein